jgi:hypothetical protein
MTKQWKQYLRHVCRSGQIYHSREMFDLFLSLIDDGTLDGVRPGFAVNDSWWTVLYSTAKERPDLASEAIAHWFDRAVTLWRGLGDDGSARPSLSGFVELSGNGEHVIEMAGKAPLSYAEYMLPRVARLVDETAKDRDDHLQADELWSYRWFGDRTLQIHGTLLSVLAQSLESVAVSTPDALNRLLKPYSDRPHDTIAYLTLRAWTVAPKVYADHIAEYLAADPRRLKVGYAAWGARGGSAKNYVSLQAVRVASQECSAERLVALERAILSLTDAREAQSPRFRGRTQLELLQAIESSRLSEGGRARLAELLRKFPGETPQAPQASEVSWIGSPVPQEALEKMSDDQWLGAMRKYAGVQHGLNRDIRRSGGEIQLAQALGNEAKENPKRFVRLVLRMPNDLPWSYFDSLVRGIAEASRTEEERSTPSVTLDDAMAVMRRVHTLPDRPCGRSIAWLIEKLDGFEWPADVTDIVSWYAINDPDPDTEEWRIASPSGTPYYGGEPYTAGINSTRGAIAHAIARLLFDRPDWYDEVREAIRHLAHDHSVAVRSCAISTLIAVLNVDSQNAIAWFTECVAADPLLLTSPYIDRFIRHAGYRDYEAVRPVIQEMLRSSSQEAVAYAARQVCVLAFDVPEAAADAAASRGGTPTMRKAAADVYSTNVAHDIVGSACRELLKPFFSDADPDVSKEAASAFQYVNKLSTADQADLLRAFLGARPNREALEPVVRALEDSSVQLPDLVCTLAEMCVEAYRSEAGDLSKAGSAVAADLSKIVIRLYAQTEDPAIQARCLDMIDEMERHYFIGLSDELQRVDR